MGGERGGDVPGQTPATPPPIGDGGKGCKGDCSPTAIAYTKKIMNKREI